MKEKKQPKQPTPVLTQIFLKEESTNRIIAQFPPTKTGERTAERYRGLADLKIIKEYNYGGKKYESN